MAGYVVYWYSSCQVSINIGIDAFLRTDLQNYDEEKPLHVHQTTTLGQFVEKADDQNTCGNCLDLPCLRSACPHFILYVKCTLFFETQLRWEISDLDDGTRACELTKDEFYGQSQYI